MAPQNSPRDCTAPKGPIMPTFRTTLPPPRAHHGFDLRRTPPTGAIVAIITSHDLLCCDTHYWAGRTLPCERTTNADGDTIDDSKCPACRAKAPWRSHVYVSAFDPRRAQHFLFECTAAAAEPLADYLRQTGTLRGCRFQATRPLATRNSKVLILTATADLSKTPIPHPPDIPAALSIIWRLPQTAIAATPPLRGKRHVTTDQAILTKMRNQPDNAGDPPHISQIIDGNGKRPRPQQPQTTPPRA
jgi:hypothetical protein